MVCTISFCRHNEALIKELSSPALDVQDIAFPTKYAQPFWQQCLACSWKQHRSYWRNPYYNVVRIILSTFYGLLFGTICWRFGHHRYYYYYYILSRLHLMKCLINYNFHNPWIYNLVPLIEFHGLVMFMIGIWSLHWIIPPLCGSFYSLIWWTFWDHCRSSQQDVLNVMGALYASTLFLGASNTLTVQPVVAVERTVFYRERAAGMYSTLPYSFAQVLCNTISPLVYLRWVVKTRVFPNQSIAERAQWQTYLRFQQSIWCVFGWNFAGDSGIALCISAIINLWNSRIFNGSIWMDSCQVLPLPFLPLFHTLSLHVLGHVDSCPYPKCSSCCNHIISCLWNLESIRRLFGSTSSKLF